MLSIKLDIVPVPKPRMTQSDRWRRRPCTDRYWVFKDQLVELWKDRELPDTFHVIFTMPIPNGWTEKRKAMFDGKPHQQKPDADNLGKAFMDALMPEDSYIHDIRLTKRWGLSGFIEVRELEPLN